MSPLTPRQTFSGRRPIAASRTFFIRAIPLALLALVAAPVTTPGRAESASPPASLAGITTAGDVDQATSDYFQKRHPGLDAPSIAAAWKSIVADGDRAPIKVIVDTDIGTDIDDAFALTFALSRRELQVCAVVTSRLAVDERAAIVSRMLQTLGRPEIPFAAGSPRRFDGSAPRDKPVGQFPFAGDPADRPAPQADAQELLRRVITENPGEIWIAVLGPLTNEALLFREHPELARQIKGIVMMGGAIDATYAETNIANDPAAADFICRLGLLRFLGTDEVTMRLLIPASDIARIRSSDTPTARMLTELTRLWRIGAPAKAGPVCFDACPLIWLIAPDLFTTGPKGLAVDAKGRTATSPAAPPCAVSTDMHLLSVHRLLMDTLTR